MSTIKLESAIAYCHGQTIVWPRHARDRAYNEGVAACVKILEDMLPYPKSKPPKGTNT